ncbi:alpha/beta hydrolase [Streptomyces sp. NPDC089799]|uniref:alpha/beta fold hydrolase n=1 Tax=Streptomyces sp. NPDC089799 TaxID=3155066 RepID=UPI003427BB56
MPTFTSYDGTELAYHVCGDPAAAADPATPATAATPDLICLPGGPMRNSDYFGDLGGLAASAGRRLILLDPRGTGASAVPADPATYRCDRQVGDVEALRLHLGLERIDLLAHSAGANLAVQYAARWPEHVGRLALITPSVMAAGIGISGELRLQTARLRADEPWFPEAYAALERVVAGEATPENWKAVTPFFHGRWDGAAQRLAAESDGAKNHEAGAAFGAEGAFDPPALREALARFGQPVLVLAGDADLQGPVSVLADFGRLFPRAELAVQPAAGHFPWLDDAKAFTTTVSAFLAD